MTNATLLERDGLAGIVSRAADGDEVAFARLVDAYHQDMRRVAFVICGDRDLAEDAAQQGWDIAWRRLGGLKRPTSLRSWLVAIAANEARRLAGRQRRRVVLEGSVEPIAGPSADPGAIVESVDLVRALARLDPSDRELLALRYVAGLDSFEIARLTGRSASGTRARLARLLARLRTELGDD
jgi:RNA polymerase sigma-70 factor (ECF subfamily)